MVLEDERMENALNGDKYAADGPSILLKPIMVTLVIFFTTS